LEKLKNKMKNYLKQVLSPTLIVDLKVVFRYAKYVMNGSFFKFVRLDSNRSIGVFHAQIIEKQVIKHGELFDNKLNNIRLTASKLSGLIIPKGAIFSFWHLVGNPSEQNGFQKSRIIRNGAVDFEVGGGVCQVSGMVYLAALKAGLTIIERHNHSVDIYEEHERISPLGADATVVYGSKDLQFVNDSDGAIQLIFNVLHDDELVLELSNSTKSKASVLSFERQDFEHKRIVKTFGELDGIKTELAVSVYKIKAKI
jgi:vancomycin resistance protein VanW